MLIICSVYLLVKSSKQVPFDQENLYEVSSVIDGDTFKVKIEKGIITVRMLGINTPETLDPRRTIECFGLEASMETRQLLIGKNVRLNLNPKRETKDKYGRYLAYVYRDDGLFVNQELLAGGYAREYTYGSAYLFQEEFRAIEKKAKSEQKGLWGKCE